MQSTLQSGVHLWITEDTDQCVQSMQEACHISQVQEAQLADSRMMVIHLEQEMQKVRQQRLEDAAKGEAELATAEAQIASLTATLQQNHLALAQAQQVLRMPDQASETCNGSLEQSGSEY